MQQASSDSFPVVQLHPATNCRCRVILRPEVILRSGGEENGGVTRPFFLPRDSRGRYYLRNTIALVLLVFDSVGRYVRTVGHQGKGLANSCRSAS